MSYCRRFSATVEAPQWVVHLVEILVISSYYPFVKDSSAHHEQIITAQPQPPTPINAEPLFVICFHPGSTLVHQLDTHHTLSRNNTYGQLRTLDTQHHLRPFAKCRNSILEHGVRGRNPIIYIKPRRVLATLFKI